MGSQGGRKVGVVGAGLVGCSFTYAMMVRELASEIILIDANAEKAIGEMMDFNHGLSFAKPMHIAAGTYEDLAGADVVVLAAGTAQRPGETRHDLLGRNAGIFRSIVPRIVHHNPDGILLVATNPVDILTYITTIESGLPPARVIGSGTILDTARFRYLLGRYYNVDPRSIHAYIVGEHGDTEIPLWSTANIGGVRLQEFAPLQNRVYDQAELDRIFIGVRDAAYEIIKRKGATYYAIGLGLLSIVEAILGNYRSVLSVSTLMQGQYGAWDVCLSLPCVVGADGIEEVLTLSLNPHEEQGFRASADALKETYRKIILPQT
jgi:L-lactate dehydrogenase